MPPAADGGLDPRRLELLRDARLSDSARILGLHLSMLGEGEHEMSFDELAALLHGTPQTETVGKHMRQLCVFGYAERTSAGGRGSPRYRWVPELSGPKKIGLEQSMPRKKSAQSATVVVDDGDVEQTPPISPLKVLDKRAERALEQHNAILAGCRGALRDYLTDYVIPEKQYAFVQLVAGWLNGIDAGVWKLPTGSSLPPPERPGMLATALNDLAASSRLMKGPVGEPANLRTKLNVLLRQRGDNERRNGGTGHHSGGASGQGSGGKGAGGSQAERRGRGFVNDESDGE